MSTHQIQSLFISPGESLTGSHRVLPFLIYEEMVLQLFLSSLEEPH